MTNARPTGTTVAVCGTIVLIALIGAVVYLTATDKEAGLLVLLLTNAVSGALAYFKASQGKDVADETAQYVNGTFHHTKALAETALASMPPQQARAVLEEVGPPPDTAPPMIR